MINLIRNELTKICKKKSIYITLLVTLAFVILTNVIYKIDFSESYYDVEEDIKFYEEQLKDLNLNNIEDKQIYAIYQIGLQVAKLIQKYGGYGTWQAEIINYNGYELISNMANYQYIEINKEKYEQEKEKYDDLIEKLDANDWRYFAQEELKDIEDNLEMQNNLKKQTTNKQEIADINSQIEQLEIEKQISNWRLEKDICYGNDYYNQCISSYRSCKSTVQSYGTSDRDNLSDKEKYEEKKNYYDALETMEISKYDIENNTHIGDSTNAKGILLNVFTEFEIFIVIMAVMIAGTIVSEEFNKGTIKLLLIKPYKRVKILTAKFITVLIMLAIVIVLVMLMQFVVGGIVQGFDSFGEPTVVYNYTTNQLEEMSIIKYLAIQTLGELLIYVLLLTVALALGVFMRFTSL